MPRHRLDNGVDGLRSSSLLHSTTLRSANPPFSSPPFPHLPRSTTASLDLAPPRSKMDMFGDPIDDSSPLWFKKDLFLSPEFEPESYISDLRTFVPFETLRSQLQSHLSALKHELVELINRDYNDFVNLSTKLVDVDSAIARMRAPLTDLRDKIVAFRESVDSSLVSLQNGLRQRAEAANVREVLELLLDTFHVVSKVEKLIKELPSVPTDWSNGDTDAAEQHHTINGHSYQHAENGSNVRETQSILLERIASEMNRLKFYMAHAKDLPFVENMEKRMQSASLLLDASLGHCFVDGLEHRDVNVIYNCLRAYAAIDNTKNAEEIFRTKIVAPFIEKVIPHSPSGVAGETAGDELAEDFQQIKQAVDKECKFLLEISSTENSGLHVFDFLANSILKEVLSAIQKGKPGAFSPGRPTEFLKNYKASLDFLTNLESYCPSRSAVSKFRAEPVYSEFMRQWNIGVYFSLRFQEIAGALDSALMSAAPTPVQNLDPDDKGSHMLALTQSVTLMNSLRSCWSDDVLLLSFSDKFLRLCLQLLSRYNSWLSSGLSCQSSSEDPSPKSKWAASANLEDLIYVIHDINFLASEVSGDYIENVLQLLASCPAIVQDLVKHSILHNAKTLEEQAPLVLKTLVNALVEKSVEDLRHLKGITATFRMTNKPLPVKHSPYISGVLRPVKAFLEGDRATRYLIKDLKNKILLDTCSDITKRYYDLAADFVNVAKKTEQSLQRMRQAAQKRVGASSDAPDQNVSDTDKLCMQLFLDLQEYGRNLAALGVDAAEIESYRSFWQCVAPADKQQEIKF